MAAATPCRLAKSIVHTFPSSGDADQNPYVFDVCSNGAGLLAVSACGPGHVIKVYDQDALTCVSQLPGHTAKVNELGFAPADSNGLFSASSDGSLRLWDLRAPSLQVHTFKTGGKEVWSASMSADSSFVAGGVATALRTWDLRTRKMFRSYVDAHTDDVTCVRAHPLLPSVFLTGSEDGLMCAVNNACPDIDDALEAVLTVDVAIFVSIHAYLSTFTNSLSIPSVIHPLRYLCTGNQCECGNISDRLRRHRGQASLRPLQHPRSSGAERCMLMHHLPACVRGHKRACTCVSMHLAVCMHARTRSVAR